MLFLSFFFFNAPATTEIYTLSLHDALPIYIGELKGLESVRYGADLQSATPINSWQIQRFPAAMPAATKTRDIDPNFSMGGWNSARINEDGGASQARPERSERDLVPAFTWCRAGF